MPSRSSKLESNENIKSQRNINSDLKKKIPIVLKNLEVTCTWEKMVNGSAGR